jgi:hypothetical protein
MQLRRLILRLLDFLGVETTGSMALRVPAGFLVALLRIGMLKNLLDLATLVGAQLLGLSVAILSPAPA